MPKPTSAKSIIVTDLHPKIEAWINKCRLKGEKGSFGTVLPNGGDSYFLPGILYKGSTGTGYGVHHETGAYPVSKDFVTYWAVTLLDTEQVVATFQTEDQAVRYVYGTRLLPPVGRRLMEQYVLHEAKPSDIAKLVDLITPLLLAGRPMRPVGPVSQSVVNYKYSEEIIADDFAEAVDGEEAPSEYEVEEVEL